MDEIEMKRLLAIIVLFLIISSTALALGKGVERPQPRDEFIYSYFSQIIVRWEYSVRYALNGEPYSLQLANLTLEELTKIQGEEKYYENMGIHSKIMDVLPPFYNFTEDLILLDRLILTLRKSPNPVIAKAILTVTSRMESDLNTIELMKLNNGTKVLTFNVEKVRYLLKEARNLASIVPPAEDFTVWVSNNYPWIGQAVTISGYFPRKGHVSVVIKGTNHSVIIPLETEDGMFSTMYRFQNTGTYKVFAIAGENTSNVITVLVTKIPTYFAVDDTYKGVVGESVTIKGVLVDAFGNALGNRTIYINGTPFRTTANGSFYFVVTSRRERKVQVTLTFEGDRTHRSASKSVSIEFSKYRLLIFLRGPSEVKRGEIMRFEGELSANISVPLKVYLCGVQYKKTLAEDGRFNFTARAEKEGTMKVFVEFEGNELYSPARSNIVTVVVTSRKIPWIRYIALLGIGMALGTLYLREKREKPEKQLKEETKDEVHEIVIENEISDIPSEVGEAFEVLLDLIRKRFHLPRSLTPREILQELGKWEHREILAKVIELHERKVYGGANLSNEEEREFFEALRVLLGVLR